jgi:hypothetical protein
MKSAEMKFSSDFAGWQSVHNKVMLIFKRNKLYSGSNYEQIEVRECLLSFGADFFVF